MDDARYARSRERQQAVYGTQRMIASTTRTARLRKRLQRCVRDSGAIISQDAGVVDYRNHYANNGRQARTDSTRFKGHDARRSGF